MKDFKLENGDTCIKNNDIVFVSGDDLLRQKIEQILGTNKKEWSFDEEEGIPFAELLTKQLDEDRVEDAIQSTLLQVDESLELDELEIETKERTAKINFTVKKRNGETLEVSKDVDR